MTTRKAEEYENDALAVPIGKASAKYSPEYQERQKAREERVKAAVAASRQKPTH